MKQLILATSNSGKIEELEALLAPIHCIPQQALGIEDAEETGLSFIENAIIKARHASRLAGQAALADDSGLVVAALGGQPGIYSARFAGLKAQAEDNIQLLLTKLASIPEGHRQAYFYCAIAVVQSADDPAPLIATGAFSGTITMQACGGHGFGYDPIFYLPEYQCTCAELPVAIKNTISHRAKALQQLRTQLS